MKILFFIPSLRSGGKERRLIELLFFLKSNTNFDIVLVLMENNIHYEYVKKLNIKIVLIERKKIKNDPSVFYRFFLFCRKFRPTIIHSWAGMTTFYAIPTKLYLNIPLIDNQISTSDPNLFNKGFFASIIFKINYFFSDKIVSNSIAGLKAYKINNKKAEVIYNGIRLDRFENLSDLNFLKDKYGITTPYVVVMVAAFMKNKNYSLFLEVVKKINNIRDDVSFIGVGGGPLLDKFKERILLDDVNNFILTGIQQNVELIIKQSDIGVLFTDSEGISNAILEYMALEKPVISNDKNGGSNEIIEESVSGYITSDNCDEIVLKMNSLLNNKYKREEMGRKGREIINSKFTIDIMGNNFLKLYNKVLIK